MCVYSFYTFAVIHNLFHIHLRQGTFKNMSNDGVKTLYLEKAVTFLKKITRKWVIIVHKSL